MPNLSILMAHPSADMYGSDRMFLAAASGLSGLGHHVTVSLPAPGPLADELKGRGIDVDLCPTAVLRRSALSPSGVLQLTWSSGQGLARGSRLLARLRPDVVYNSTVTIPLWSILGRIHRIPVLTHVHEAEGSAHPALRTALAMPLFAASAVIANSRYAAEVQERSFPPLRGRMRVVFNGVDGPPEPKSARAEICGPVRLLYIGRLSERKGVDVAVRAVELLHHRGIAASLAIVGSVYRDDEPYEQALRTAARESGLESSVVFHGYQSSVWPFLEEADIVLVPSRRDESFGNTAVEAMLAARPAVVSDTSGLREAAGGYQSVKLVPAGDAAQLAGAVELILGDWTGFRDAAVADSAAAANRHSPGSYHDALSAELLRTAQGLTSPGLRV
ncbi:glycosyltransferase [Arthrobacter sp. NPDC055585]